VNSLTPSATINETNNFTITQRENAQFDERRTLRATLVSDAVI